MTRLPTTALRRRTPIPPVEAPGTAGSRVVTLTLTNPDDVAIETRLTLNAGAFSSAGSPLPIPEPSTYAMLAAGLGVIGMLGRSRQRA